MGQAPEKEQADNSDAVEQFRSLLPDKLTLKITEDHIHSVLSVRRAREAIFGQHLFSDPAWDMILELYAAKLGRRTMPISELARAINAPESVVLRWLVALRQAGIVAGPEHQESGSIAVELTADGAAKFAQLVDQWGSAFLAI